MQTGRVDGGRRVGLIVGVSLLAIVALAGGAVLAVRADRRESARTAAANGAPTPSHRASGSATPSPSPTGGQRPPARAYLQNRSSSARPCLGVPAGGGPVAVASCLPREAWTLDPVTGAADTYTVKATSCLTGSGTEAVYSACADTANQRWRTVPTMDGFELVNLGTGGCLTAPDPNLTSQVQVGLSGCTGSVAQVWILRSTPGS
jgi:hypothetical protein